MSRLNGDVLTHIFLECIDSLAQTSGRTLDEPIALLLTIQFVCRAWRDVSKRYPRLWGRLMDVDRGSVEWFMTVLERSGASPLYVVSDGRSGPHSSTTGEQNRWEVIQAHFHRCVYLDVALPRDSCGPGSPLLWIQAPKLNECKITSYSRSTKAIIPDTSARDTSVRLFAGHAPRLLRLRLVNCVLPPDFTPHTFLSLEDFGTMTYSAPPLDWLTSASPNVRQMALTSFPTRVLRWSPSNPRFQFPMLEQLHLTMDSNNSGSILDLIEVSDICSFNFFIILSPSLVPFITLASLWSGIFRPSEAIIFSSLAIRLEDPLFHIRLASASGRVLQVSLDVSAAEERIGPSIQLLPGCNTVFDTMCIFSLRTIVTKFRRHLSSLDSLIVESDTETGLLSHCLSILAPYLNNVSRLRMEHPFSSGIGRKYYEELKLGAGGFVLLPKLSTLELPRSLQGDCCSTERLTSSVTDFILWRAKCSFPVTPAFYDSPSRTQFEKTRHY